MAGQPHVQSDRHHARAVRALFMEKIEAVAQKGEEILARAEHAAAEFRIVGSQRIGDDEMRALADPHPIRQFVIVGVAVVEEAAVLDQQPARVFRWGVAAIPAQWGFGGGLADQLGGCGDLLALLRFAEARMVGPAIAVAADVPVAGGDCCSGRRVGLEGAGAAEDRYGHTKAGEDPMQAPKADAGAVFEHALGTKVAARDPQIRAEHLGETALADAVAGGIGELRAFLEVDHEVDGDASAAGPLGMRWLGAVPDEISCHRFPPGGSGYQSNRPRNGVPSGIASPHLRLTLWRSRPQFAAAATARPISSSSISPSSTSL